jgi:hypothetical protein
MLSFTNFDLCRATLIPLLQEREQLAKEHFVLLQKQRRLLEAAAAPPPPQPQLPPLMAPLQQQQGSGPVPAGLFAVQQQQQQQQQQQHHLHQQHAAAGSMAPTAAALELWAAAHAGGGAPVTGFSGLHGLLSQHAQHDRSDSLELLSEQQGLLDLLNDFPPEPAPAPGQAAMPAAAAAGDALETATAANGEPLRSPTATTVSDGWDVPPASSVALSGGLGAPAFGSGRWSSIEGSVEGGIPGDPSPITALSLLQPGAGLRMAEHAAVCEMCI